MFASRTQKTITTPSGSDVVIRKLSGFHLEKAETALPLQRMANATVINAYNRAMKDDAPEEDDAPKTPKAKNPLAGLDVQTVLEKGIVSFPDDVPVNAETVADLEADDRDFIATELMRLARPSLFDEGAAEKNA